MKRYPYLLKRISVSSRSRVGTWYNVRVYPEAEGISVYFQASTALKQAQEALRGCEERLRVVPKSDEETAP